MDTIPLIKYSAPKELSCRSSQPITSTTYELRPRLIEMVQSHTFSGKLDEDPILHLRTFDEICNCLRIEGMTDETIRWMLFPFSLKGRARQWYDQTKEEKKGDWGILSTDFWSAFYPVSKVVNHRTQILSFKQKDNESMSSAWDRFDLLYKSEPDLALQDQSYSNTFMWVLIKNVEKN